MNLNDLSIEDIDKIYRVTGKTVSLVMIETVNYVINYTGIYFYIGTNNTDRIELSRVIQSRIKINEKVKLSMLISDRIDVLTKIVKDDNERLNEYIQLRLLLRSEMPVDDSKIPDINDKTEHWMDEYI